MMNSFALCPLQRGYTPKVANNLLEQELMGGFARQRVQFINNTHTVSPSVLLDTKDKQEYFWAFWRSHQQKPRPFLWRLIIDSHDAKTYQCQFVASSLNVGERDGIVYSVSFDLRVRPDYTDAGFDQEIIDAWNFGNPKIWSRLLEKLVNENMP